MRRSADKTNPYALLSQEQNHAHLEDLVSKHQLALAQNPELARHTRKALLQAIQGLIVREANKYADKVQRNSGVALDANEVIQEAFLVVASRIDTYRGSNKPNASLLPGWVIRVIQMEMPKSEAKANSPVTYTDEGRKQAKKNGTLFARSISLENSSNNSTRLDGKTLTNEPQLTEDEHEEKEAMLKAIEDNLHVLTELQQQIIRAYHFKVDIPRGGRRAGLATGSSHARVGETLGITQATLKREYAAAIQRLREELA